MTTFPNYFHAEANVERKVKFLDT